MSIVEAVETLRAATAAAVTADDAAVRTASRATAFATAEVVAIPGAGGLDHVAVELAWRIDLADLEAAFGPARALPIAPDGTDVRTHVFDATFPTEGSAGGTLLVEVEADGTIARLAVRRDVL